MCHGKVPPSEPGLTRGQPSVPTLSRRNPLSRPVAEFSRVGTYARHCIASPSVRMKGTFTRYVGLKAPFMPCGTEYRCPSFEGGPYPSTVLPGLPDERNAGAVSQMNVARGVQDGEVCPCACGKAAHIRALERSGTASGCCPEGLTRRQSPLTDGERDAERHARRIRRARVAVRRQRNGRPGAEEPAGVRVGRTSRELGAREQSRNRRGTGKRIHIGG